MPLTRLAFVDVPRMTRELVVSALAASVPVTVCSEELGPGDLVRSVCACEADLLVVGGDRLADPGMVCRLLEARPRLKAIAILDGGRRAVFYELRPSRTVQELSADVLVTVARIAGLPCATRLGDEPGSLVRRSVT